MTTSGGPGSKMEELALFYEEVRRNHGAALWNTEMANATPDVVPYIWKWADFKPLMYQAARIVPMEQTERRVLVFSNPGLEGTGRPAATTTLLANLKIINPGEIAKTHRHAASALRLVVEGQGAYTAVNGERSFMDPGDFITTPNGTWHGHGNEGDVPMIWIDGLDVPLVATLQAAYQERYTQDQQEITRPDDLSLRLYGNGSLRPTWETHRGMHSPIINYKFEQTYEALTRLAQDTDGSPHDGVCLEYTNPVTGGSAMATMACFAQLLRPGKPTTAHRHTGGTIYHVTKGRGHSIIDGKRFNWDEKDTFVVPSWAYHEHEADVESVLFVYNDTPVIEKLGLYREEALEENNGHQAIAGVFEPIPVEA